MSRDRLLQAVAAVAVAALAIALGGCAAWALPQLRPVAALWCFVPLAWGVWAMLAPPSWVPGKLPLWGALLGILAWLMALMVLDLPARLLGLSLGYLPRALLAAPVLAFYYLLWMAVRDLYVRLLAKT